MRRARRRHGGSFSWRPTGGRSRSVAAATGGRQSSAAAYTMAIGRARAAASVDPPDVGGVIHDYPLGLAPRMLAELRPDVKIAHFSPTPWAPVEYFRLPPDAVAAEVLDGILGADHAG